MAAFCQTYYAIDPSQFAQPESHAPLGYLFPFLDSQGETVNLNMATNTTGLTSGDTENRYLILSFNSRGA